VSHRFEEFEAKWLGLALKVAWVKQLQRKL